MVLTGRRVSLDSIGRLVYAIRSVVREVAVFDYRGAVPDTGASTVFRLGDSPVAARDAPAGAASSRRRAERPSGRPVIAVAARPASRALTGASRPAGAGIPTIPRPCAAAPHRPVDPRASFPELEEQVLAALARARRVRRSRSGAGRARPSGASTRVRRRPTATPGTHHVLSRVFKDIFPRYRTMTGHYVERKGGWDCHGLRRRAGRRGRAGHDLQGGHRALRDRRVQRPLPPEGAQPRRASGTG